MASFRVIILGFNYGDRRGRMEPLKVSNIVAAAIGETSPRYEHADIQEYYAIVNRRLDDADERLQQLA